MFVSSCRALVLSLMALALRTSSYANSITLITITIVITNIKKKNQRLYKPKKQGYIGKRRTNIKNTFSWVSAGLTLKTRLE